MKKSYTHFLLKKYKSKEGSYKSEALFFSLSIFSFKSFIHSIFKKHYLPLSSFLPFSLFFPLLIISAQNIEVEQQ